jgi:flagellar biosynthetic protein FliR
VISDLITEQFFPFVLVFCRLGGAMMLMPTIGEAGVPSRVRMHFAIAFTVIITPLLADTMPDLPGSPLALFVLIAGEVVIGLFFGGLTRIVTAALHVGGMIFAFQSSLAAAQIFDPNQSAQTSITGNFMSLLALLVIFATNLHHLLLAGLTDSYLLFPAGQPFPWHEGADAIARAVADAFRIGLQIATPVVVAGFLLYLGAGLLNRLMPQMMVFFIMLPLQITLAFVVLAISLSTILYWFINFFDETLMMFSPV